MPDGTMQFTITRPAQLGTLMSIADLVFSFSTIHKQRQDTSPTASQMSYTTTIPHLTLYVAVVWGLQGLSAAEGNVEQLLPVPTCLIASNNASAEEYCDRLLTASTVRATTPFTD
jgi:hypothetical protein